MKKLEINKKDLKNNIEIIKQMNQETEKDKKPEIIGVVKANGVGLDLIQYSKFLVDNGINTLAVAVTQEAIKLRKEAKIENDIIMLSPTIIKEEIQELVENDIILTVGNFYELELIKDIASKLKKENIRIYIKIDTGLARFGFLYNDIENIIKVFENADFVKIEGMYTHFSKCSDEKWTNIQFKRFLDCVENVRKLGYSTGKLHAASSTAFIKYPEMRLDAVRLGSIFQGRTLKKVDGLVKIGTFKTSISEIKTLPKGYNISYGKIYKTKKITRVAVIPVGYIDGFNKDKLRDDFTFKNNLISVGMEIKKIFKDNSLKVKIRDKSYKVLGRIGMYHAIIDITSNWDIQVGDEVIINITPLQANDEIRREYI